MIIGKKRLIRVIKEAFGIEAADPEEVKKLKESIERLKLDRKMEEENLKHLTKMANEKREFELERAKVRLEQEYAQKASDSLTKFHGKLETRFNEEAKNIKEVYTEIIKRLPNVNVEMKKDL